MIIYIEVWNNSIFSIAHFLVCLRVMFKVFKCATRESHSAQVSAFENESDTAANILSLINLRWSVVLVSEMAHQNCIIHSMNLVHHGSFTSLCNIKGCPVEKLAYTAVLSSPICRHEGCANSTCNSLPHFADVMASRKAISIERSFSLSLAKGSNRGSVKAFRMTCKSHKGNIQSLGGRSQRTSLRN